MDAARRPSTEPIRGSLHTWGVRTTTPRPRKPAGTPPGGQFTTKTRPEPGYSLTDEPELVEAKAESEPKPTAKERRARSIKAAQLQYRAAWDAWRAEPGDPQLREAAVSTAAAWTLLWGRARCRLLAAANLDPEDLASEAAARTLAERKVEPSDLLRSARTGPDRHGRRVTQMAGIIRGHPDITANQAIKLWREIHGGSQPVSDVALLRAWQLAGPSSPLSDEHPDDGEDEFDAVDDWLDRAPEREADRRTVADVRVLLEQRAAEASTRSARRRADAHLTILDALLEDPHVSVTALTEEVGANRETAAKWLATVKALFTGPRAEDPAPDGPLAPV